MLLFLLGCVNVSGLFVARAAGRAQEVAVRTALGAEPGHLMRRHVVEGLLYGLLGGVAGVAVAAAAIPALYALVPVDLPAWMQFRLDRRTIAFAASATIGTGLVIGATSLAWHMRPRLADALRPGDKGGLETGPSSRLRGQLIVVQVALSVALLVGTGLTVRSLLHLGRVDTGIRTDGVLVASVTGDVVLSATREETIARHARGFRQMREALGTLPGVRAVTAATRIPFLNAAEERPVYELHSRQRNTPATAYRGALRTSNAMPEYFGMLGVPMLDGRDFADSDTLETPPVAIVSRRAGGRASCSFKASIPWGSRYGGASIRTSGRRSSVSFRTRRGIRPMTAAYVMRPPRRACDGQLSRGAAVSGVPLRPRDVLECPPRHRCGHPDLMCAAGMARFACGPADRTA